MGTDRGRGVSDLRHSRGILGYDFHMSILQILGHAGLSLWIWAHSGEASRKKRSRSL